MASILVDPASVTEQFFRVGAQSVALETPKNEFRLTYEDLEKLTPPNSELLRLAKNNPPPKWWLEGGEECPF